MGPGALIDKPDQAYRPGLLLKVVQLHFEDKVFLGFGDNLDILFAEEGSELFWRQD